MNRPLCTHTRSDSLRGLCGAPVSHVKMCTHEDGRVYEIFNCYRCMSPSHGTWRIKVSIITLEEWQVLQVMKT